MGIQFRTEPPSFDLWIFGFDLENFWLKHPKAVLPVVGSDLSRMRLTGHVQFPALGCEIMAA